MDRRLELIPEAKPALANHCKFFPLGGYSVEQAVLYPRC
jgi:hypothetical protein